MENKLSQKIEILSEIISSFEKENLEAEATLKKVEGYSFAHKDILEKFEEHVKKQQAELGNLVQSGKLNQQIANFVNSSLLTSLKRLKDLATEAEKLYYVRQGESLSTRTKIANLKNDRASVLVELETLKRIVEQPSVQVKKADDVIVVETTRPDKNPRTKIGRAAMDLAARKKASRGSLEEAQKQEENSEKNARRRTKKNSQ